MESGDNFPWEILKAECLRLVCQQLSMSSEPGLTNTLRKRDDMIRFLRDVHARGLDSALKTLGKTKQAQPASSSVKRKNMNEGEEEEEELEEEEEEEDDGDQYEDPDTVNAQPQGQTTSDPHQQTYNTRFKGVKRVKLAREAPDGFLSASTVTRGRRPRKSAPADLTAATTAETRVSGPPPPLQKRPRGRPRKNPLPPVDLAQASPSVATGAPATPGVGRPPASTMKQVFDGVEVVKRSPKKVDNAAVASHHDLDADADAEGEVDGEDVWSQPVDLNGVGGQDGHEGQGSHEVQDGHEGQGGHEVQDSHGGQDAHGSHESHEGQDARGGHKSQDGHEGQLGQDGYEGQDGHDDSQGFNQDLSLPIL